VGGAGLTDDAAEAGGASAVDVALALVFDAIHARRDLALVPHADAAEAVRPHHAVLPRRALRADGAAAVDVALVLVLHLIGAARLADAGGADAAPAVHGATALLARLAEVRAHSHRARAAAVDVGLVAVLHHVHA